MNFPPDLQTALRRAQNIAVLTGAGVSAESGIPTFRDAQTGLWAQFKPEDLATRDAFAANPQRVWEWYDYRRKMIAAASPNPGHAALAALEKLSPGFTLITQNIDGLHRAAGSQNILELHGSIWRVRCFEHGHAYAGQFTELPAPPICPQCGSLVRPDVVWFGETLPAAVYEAARSAALACDLFLLVGTSSLVYPAASLPLLATGRGVLCIEINPATTPLTNRVSHSLRGRSGEILPALVEAYAARNVEKEKT